MAERLTLVCAFGTCGKVFSRLASRVRNNQELRDMAGPFCSRQCSTRYARSRRDG